MPNVTFVLKSPFFCVLLAILKELSVKELHRLNQADFIDVQQAITARQHRGNTLLATAADWSDRSVPVLRSQKQRLAQISRIQSFFAMVRARWRGER